MTKITVAGTIVVDAINIIDHYPRIGMLADIKARELCVGGAVPNVSIDLATLGMDVHAVGRVGADNEGTFVCETLKNAGIDTKHIIVSNRDPTSFSNVMTVESTGERTFFATRGANVRFCEADIPNSVLDCSVFHIGYLLLLDMLDMHDAEFGTAMARLLAHIQERGIKTSIDVVSGQYDLFQQVVLPALPFCDYVFMNEIEASYSTGIEIRDPSGNLRIENVPPILSALYNRGSRSVIVHCPEAGFMMSSSGYTVVPSFELPAAYIKNTVGAGDAFCAGALYGITHGFSDSDLLAFASSCAAANLASNTSIGGALSVSDTEELVKQFNRRRLC
ncbi:MAG: carbohydrate kinase family protein [Treponema sp.]|jgi:sugar/nucleoside kinase (ribokinase family)|nr:carbohydrate kinase family protein [Treponema sp.]